MNYFAHALPFLDDPYFVAGTGVPDWLQVVDRRVRVRARNAETFIETGQGPMVAVARGILQHLRDDRRFHETRAFAETSMEVSAMLRAALPCNSSLSPGLQPLSPTLDPAFRASFVGHVLVEVLLDAVLIRENPSGATAYYRAFESVDVLVVQETVNRIAVRSTERLAPFIPLFCRERILWDYLEDDKLLMRLNQVMRRIGFELLPGEVQRLFPAARALIGRRRRDLLDGIPA
jgi:hypothetical protein